MGTKFFNFFSVEFPVGKMLFIDYEGKLYYSVFTDHTRKNVIESFSGYSGASPRELKSELIKEAELQLNQYLSSERKEFSLPLGLKGTEFQLEVWKKMREIPFGETVTYRQLASMIGRPRSVRAVANAVGANPLPIIIPCHRVVASDGSEGGYTGPSGTKHKLLSLEKSL